MPEILDHVAYLSQEVGPRPAGTEEEQQAALYITEQMQREAGLPAVIEDFNAAPDADIPCIICCACSIVFAVLSLFLPVLGIAAIVVTLLAALLFAAEAFGRPVLSRALARGVSQNVVAKYEPGYSTEAGGSRRRRVILVAHYDSGKVRAELRSPLINMLHVLRWASFGAIALLPILLVVRNIVFLNVGGIIATVLDVLVIIAVILVAIPLVLALLHKFSSYNEGANCNAAGTAVLLEVARRVGLGRVSEAELAEREEVSIHGEQAAREAGLVPEGAEITYEDEGPQPPELSPQTPEDRLAAAKAAVAALSGRSVSSSYASDIAQNLVQVKDQPLPQPSDSGVREQRDETREAFTSIPPDTMQEALANAQEASSPQNEDMNITSNVETDLEGTTTDEFSDRGAAILARESVSGAGTSEGVPDWFKKAQEKAKKPHADKPVQRSRYATALDAAVNESSNHFAEANKIVEQRLEESLGAGHNATPEVKAPQWSPTPPESDPSSTTAMPPIDVSTLNLTDQPVVSESSASAFRGTQNAPETSRVSDWSDEQTEGRSDASSASFAPRDRVEGDMFFDEPSNEESVGDKVPARRPIVLPDIGITSSKPAPIAEIQKQRAPLADVEGAGKTAAKSLLTMLPSISLGEAEPAGETGDAQTAAPLSSSDTTRKSSLRSTLPSLSGAINSGDTSDARTAVSTAGSFAPAGATGAFAPVGDELLNNVDPDDIYVDDADDSDYDENFTETGAFAGPGYVEMPKSRTHRLFGRFRRKNKEEEPTPQEWLDVDDSFDARTVGEERGGWESFRDEDSMQDPAATTRVDAYEDEYEDEFEDYNDDVDDFDDSSNGKRRSWHGGAFSSRRRESVELDFDEPSAEDAVSDFATDVSSELKQIYKFRNPDIDTEVWFVALGSELAQNGGMRAFLTEHQQDLRGSIVVELDGLGAGTLCMVDREGMYRTAKTSSRMGRYVKKASRATGIDVGSAHLLWEDSASSFAIKHGYQAMHLVGMDGAKPAYFAQGDDVLENIDEEILNANVDYVMELLKNI